MTVEYRKLIQELEVDNQFNVRDDLKGLTLDEINQVQPKNEFAVCVLNLTGSLNVASIMRTAVLYGCEEFIIGGRRRWDRRSSVGAEKYMKITYLDHMLSETEIDYETIFDEIRNLGYRLVFIEQGGCDLHKIKLHWTNSSKPCFIFGNEGIGIPEKNLVGQAGQIVSISHPGVMRSLNVSVAAGIVMNKYYTDYLKG